MLDISLYQILLTAGWDGSLSTDAEREPAYENAFSAGIEAASRIDANTEMSPSNRDALDKALGKMQQAFQTWQSNRTDAAFTSMSDAWNAFNDVRRAT